MREIHLLNKEENEIIFSALTVEEFKEIPLPRDLFFIHNKREYASDFCTFDIETAHDAENVHAWLYHWQAYCFGSLIFGRTWEEFEDLLDYLSRALELTPEKQIVFYVHNLGYEMGFMIMRYMWAKVFARSAHDPLYCVPARWQGIEFRDSAALLMKTLESATKDDVNCPFLKQKDKIDYNALYTPASELPVETYEYNAVDVIGLWYCIKSVIFPYKSASMAPLTSTGIVRRHARNTYGKTKEWRRICRKLTLTAPVYHLYSDAARGGDTHCEAWASAAWDNSRVWENVYSRDIASSYPYELIAGDYPLSAPNYIGPEAASVQKLGYIISQGWIWVADVILLDLKLKDSDIARTYIPVSKCLALDPAYVDDNGRVAVAKYLQISITSIDFEIIGRYYDFELAGVKRIVYHLKSGPLPRCFGEFILDLYKKKTALKGLKDRADDYMNAKRAVNGIFGMCYTRLLRPKIVLTASGEWMTLPVYNDNEELLSVQESRNFFTPYPIGVFCTANARRSLHEGLRRCSAALYWDTDSIKHRGDHSAIFEKISAEKLQRLRDIGYTDEEFSPLDVKGKRHPLGVWEAEDEYGDGATFKSFGAKKYFLKDRFGEEHITVAGLSKKDAIKWFRNEGRTVLSVEYGDIIPPEYSGRLSAAYHLEEFELIVNGYPVHEYSCVCLEPVTYEFGDDDKGNHIRYVEEAYKIWLERGELKEVNELWPEE